MYCVQCSQLCTITNWPFRDTKAYFRLTLFSRNGLWLFYRAKWESNDEGEKINKEKKCPATRKLIIISLVETTFDIY